MVDGSVFLNGVRGRGLTVCALLSVAGAFACSGTPANNRGFLSDSGMSLNSHDGGGGGTTTSEGGGMTLHTEGGLPSSGDDAADDEDCPESAKLVYVTGIGAKLYSFYPPTLKFTLIGTLNCLQEPTHMTVDRTGTAWVVGADGLLYNASTTTAQCSAVSTWKANPGNFPDFALTFLGTTNAPDTSLYIFGESGELGSFNTQSGAVSIIGMPDVHSPGGDMTTNGDGTLYFLMDVTQPELFEFNPTNAAVIKEYAIKATGGGDQALANYGGSFYAFEGMTVNAFDPKTGSTMFLENAPIQVTGAGQSTCVPQVPPMSK